MDSLLANYEEGKNFWKLYPTWKIPKAFKDLYDSDKSKDKKDSSIIMWGAIFINDKNLENPYRELDSNDKIEVVNDDIIGDSKFDWKKYQAVLDEVKKLLTTEVERNYYTFIEYMEARRRFIETQQNNLDFETMKQLDDSIKRNADIMKEMDRLKAAIELSGDEGSTKGGKIESSREKGLF